MSERKPKNKRRIKSSFAHILRCSMFNVCNISYFLRKSFIDIVTHNTTHTHTHEPTVHDYLLFNAVHMLQHIQTYCQFIVDRELNTEFQLNTAIDSFLVDCCIIECASRPSCSMYIYMYIYAVNQMNTKYEIIQYYNSSHSFINSFASQSDSHTYICVQCAAEQCFCFGFSCIIFFFSFSRPNWPAYNVYHHDS